MLRSMAVTCLVTGMIFARSSVAEAVPPANDTPAGAIMVTPAMLPFVDQRDVSDATADPSSPSGCFSDHPQKSVWYTFTSTGAATVEIDTLGSNYDTSLSVFHSCGGGCTSGDECAQDSGGKQSQVTLDASAATVYHVMVELAEGATCPAEGCQLVLSMQSAREHVVELRATASSPTCFVGVSLSASRRFASDSDSRSGTDTATASVTGVGTDFSLRGSVLEFCGTEIRPLVAILSIDSARVGFVENLLADSRSIEILGYEIREATDAGEEGVASRPSGGETLQGALAVDDPDLPSGTIVAAMNTKGGSCRVTAGVDTTRRSPRGDSDSTSHSRSRRRVARAAILAESVSSMGFWFEASDCRKDSGKISATATFAEQAVGSGFLKLRSGYARLSGRSATLP